MKALQSTGRIPARSRLTGTPTHAAAGATGRLFASLLLLLAFLPVAAWAQEIQVRGGTGLNIIISDGDTTPTSTDGTVFGSTNVTGGAIEKTFQIRNTNSSDGNPFNDLSISSISENSSHFSISAGAPIPLFPVGLNGQATHNFTVRFDPTSTGTKTATVTIRNNDSNEDPYTFSIRGVGVGVPEIAVSYPDIFGDGVAIPDGDTGPSTSQGTHFGTVDALGTDVTRTFRVRNSGTGTLTISSFSDGSSDWVTSGLASSIAPGSFDDFTIRFNPQSSGTKNATITINNNDSNENPYTFAVRGVARAPEIQVQGGSSLNIDINDGDTTPNTTDRTAFGSRDIAAGPLDRTFRIRNEQSSDGIPFTGDLVVSSISDNSSQFSIIGAPVLPIGEASFADFTIRFDPTSAGVKNATITILNNDPDGGESTYTFSVTGTGTASSEISVFGNPVPLLSDGTFIADGDTTPSTGDGTHFGNVYVGSPQTNTYRIKNTGSATLTLGFSDNSSRFGFSSTVSSIPPGGFDDFNITFTPLASGTVTATITLDTNDPDGGEDPYTFTVRGTGKAPEINVQGGAGLNVNILDGDTTPNTTDGTDFGSIDISAGPIDKTFEISNLESSDGLPFTGDLVISSLTENSTHFSILSAPVLPIGEGSAATFTVRFDPTSLGVKTATVTINHNDPDGGEQPYNFTITGEGTGEPEIQVFGLPSLISDGTLIVSGDTTPRSADGTDFGNADVLALIDTTHTFRVKNIGTAPMTVAVSENSSQYQVTESLNSTIPAGGFDDFNVTFNPTSSGIKTATVTIANDDPDGGESPFTYTITGLARAPEIAVRGGAGLNIDIVDGDTTPNLTDGTDFGSADITGGAVEKTFRINNLQSSDGIPLTGDLIITSITENSTHFSIVSGPILPIGEASSADFTVRFDPSALGNHNAVVTIVHNDPDGAEAPFNFTITGEGTGEPEIEVFGLPIPILSDGTPIASGDTTPRPEDGTHYGTVDALALLDTTHTFRVKNTGTAPLTVSVADNSAHFDITEPLNSSIPPGGFDDFNITFDPLSSGAKTATVTITNDDPDGGESPFIYDLAGVATAPEITVSGGPGLNLNIPDGDNSPRVEDGTDFGEVSVTSGAVEKTYRIRNVQRSDGLPLTGDLVITSITENSTHFSIVSGPILPIGEEGFADFTVRFDPNDVGTQNATVTIANNDPDDGEGVYTFAITGVGLGESEIEVFGNPIPILSDGVSIANGDSTPDTADGTDFGDVDALALLDASRTYRVKNTGTAPMVVSVVEDSSQFQITEPLLASIPPNGGFDDFTITFNPQASGVHNATVTITNDDPDGGENPYTFDITGRAFAPEISVRGGSDGAFFIADGDTTPRVEDNTIMRGAALGASSSETFRIQNLVTPDGIPFTGDLVVSAINVSNPAFSITAGAPLPVLPIFIGQGNFHEFTVSFTPPSAGTFSADISIVHNDPDGTENPYNFRVEATGGDPDIHVSFIPPGTSNFVGIPNGATNPQVADGTDFGTHVLADSPFVSRVFNMLNTGGTDLTVNVTYSGDTGEFFGADITNQIVNPNLSLGFGVAYNPLTVGTHEMTITITSNDPDESPYTFLVRGVATGPQIEVLGGDALDVPIADDDLSPSVTDNTDFGNAEVGGSPVSHTFRVTNEGSDALTISDIVEGSPDFEVTGAPATVAAGATEDFTITFAPQTTGAKSVNIVILSDAPETGANIYLFRVQGNGVDADSEPVNMTGSSFGPGSGSVTFETIPGRTYRITSGTNMVDFDPLPGFTGIPGTGGPVEVDLSAFAPSPANPTRFFRVELEPLVP